MKLRVTGTNSLMKHLRQAQNLDEVRQSVRKHGANLQQTMMDEATFTKGYSKGTTKRSIALEMRDDSFTASVQPHTHYASYVEYGTRFMDAQPFVRPAFRKIEPVFISDMKRLLK